ncbi:hypothetical protein SUGI_1072240 [Cryptomeria japonica]|nr:hypothetical protein SUGI_1072240 [Cryptomeria japonica]
MDFELQRDALSDLRSNRLQASDFPLIEVARDEDGVLWSKHNRRLWLFRKAGVSTIKVNLYSRPLFRAPPEPHLREEMGREDYFPRVRRRPVITQRNPPFRAEQERQSPPDPRSQQERQNPPDPFANIEMPGLGMILKLAPTVVLKWGARKMFGI